MEMPVVTNTTFLKIHQTVTMAAANAVETLETNCTASWLSNIHWLNI